MIRAVVLLMQALPAQHFPSLEHPGAALALRTTVDGVCGNPAALDRAALLAREDRLAIAAHDAPASVTTWTDLGCARAALDGDGALSRPGLLMVAGNSWAHGAERALQQALALEPANPRAIEVLALLALDDLEPDDVKTAGAAVSRAVAAGVQSPATLRACDELSLRLNDVATARRCATLGLSLGRDSTWHLVRLARVSFRDADTVSGVNQFLAAMAAAHDSAARDEVDWQLQWFLSPDEQRALSGIPDSGRTAWVRDRLAERDVRDGQPPGARLAEHFNRLDYALANFPLRIPVAIRKKGGLLAAVPENRLSPDSLHSFCEPGLLPASPFREYHRWQSEIDDRGVVWLRFGAPLKRIRSSPQCADTVIGDPIALGTGDNKAVGAIAVNTREVWYYEIDGKPLLLNFEGENLDGSVEATRLVSGVLGSYLCDVDTVRCGLTELSIADWTARTAKYGTPSSSYLVTPEAIEHVRADDRAFIATATTTDDNSIRGDRDIGLVSRLHRLWDPLSGAPIALVTYALPVKDLAIQEERAARTTLIDLALRQWDPAANRWQDTAFSRHFLVPDTSVKRANLVGFVVMPSSPGVSAWSLVASQPDHRRGRAFDVATPGLSGGPVALSDLVLGAVSQGVEWNFHNVAIPLAPVNAVDRAGAVSLYYQIRSASARGDLRTTVALYRMSDGVARDSAALQVTFDQALRSGVNEVAPTLDVSELALGRYQLEVRMIDARGGVVARRNTILELQ